MLGRLVKRWQVWYQEGNYFPELQFVGTLDECEEVCLNIIQDIPDYVNNDDVIVYVTEEEE